MEVLLNNNISSPIPSVSNKLTNLNNNKFEDLILYESSQNIEINVIK